MHSYRFILFDELDIYSELFIANGLVAIVPSILSFYNIIYHKTSSQYSKGIKLSKL